MRVRYRSRCVGFWALALGMAISVSALAKPKPRAAKPSAKPATEASAKGAETEAEKAGEPATPPEPAVKAAGTSATKDASKDPKAKVTSVEESAKEKGVKTYKFSAVEVEGRLKSPQIAYFLRRVRAEFEAGDLGHRSFMPELSDSRRSPSLR